MTQKIEKRHWIHLVPRRRDNIALYVNIYKVDGEGYQVILEGYRIVKGKLITEKSNLSDCELANPAKGYAEVQDHVECMIAALLAKFNQL